MMTNVPLSVKGVIEYVDFFNEGWAALTSMERGRGDLNWDEFFKLVLHAASHPEGEAIVVLHASKNMKPLGFSIAFNGSEPFSSIKRLIYYCGYSNGKYPHGPVEAVAYVENWARKHGYNQVQLLTRRISGASVRFYRRKLQYQPQSIVFYKEL